MTNDEPNDNEVGIDLFLVSLGIDSLIDYWVLDSTCV